MKKYTEMSGLERKGVENVLKSEGWTFTVAGINKVPGVKTCMSGFEVFVSLEDFYFEGDE